MVKGLYDSASNAYLVVGSNLDEDTQIRLRANRWKFQHGKDFPKRTARVQLHDSKTPYQACVLVLSGNMPRRQIEAFAREIEQKAKASPSNNGNGRFISGLEAYKTIETARGTR